MGRSKIALIRPLSISSAISNSYDQLAVTRATNVAHNTYDKYEARENPLSEVTPATDKILAQSAVSTPVLSAGWTMVSTKKSTRYSRWERMARRAALMFLFQKLANDIFEIYLLAFHNRLIFDERIDGSIVNDFPATN